MKVSKNVSEETLRALGEIIKAARREDMATEKKLHPKFYQWLRENREVTIDESEHDYYLLTAVIDTFVDDEGVYACLLYAVWSDAENDWVNDEDGVVAVDDIEYEWDEVSDEDRAMLEHAHDWELRD